MTDLKREDKNIRIYGSRWIYYTGRMHSMEYKLSKIFKKRCTLHIVHCTIMFGMEMKLPEQRSKQDYTLPTSLRLKEIIQVFHPRRIGIRQLDLI
jgi:hypothetical protein